MHCCVSALSVCLMHPDALQKVRRHDGFMAPRIQKSKSASLCELNGSYTGVTILESLLEQMHPEKLQRLFSRGEMILWLWGEGGGGGGGGGGSVVKCHGSRLKCDIVLECGRSGGDSGDCAATGRIHPPS